MDRPIAVLAVTVAVPFVASIVAAWAWRWWGVGITVAGGIAVTALTYMNQVIAFINGPRPPVHLATIFLAWLVGLIPGSIIGFAIRSLVTQMRKPSMPDSSN
jgi:hypothetical protein